MTRRKTLSDAGVRALKAKAARYTHPDPELSGHYVRVSPSGEKSFVVVARDPFGKQIWATIGSVDHYAIADSRERAREAVKRIKAGQPPFPPPAPKADTFEAIAADYRKRHVEANG